MPSAIQSLPRSIDAEKAVLSCALQDPAEFVPQIHEHLFYLPAHQIIAKALRDIYDANQGDVDVILLNRHLTDHGKLEGVGGPRYVVELLDDVPSTSLFSEYVAVLEDKAKRRALIALCGTVNTRAHKDTGKADDILESAAASLMKIGETGADDQTFDLRTILIRTQEQIEQAYGRGAGVNPGLSTGLKGLDDLCLGMGDGKMIVLAGRTSTGKSALAANIVDAVAITNRKKVLIFALEMDEVEWGQRLLAKRSGVRLTNIVTANLNKEQLNKVMTASSIMADAQINVDFCPGSTVERLAAKCRRWKQAHGLDFVVIDYFQLLRTEAIGQTREKLAHISHTIMALGKELRIPILLLAQLNRNAIGKRPNVGDLAECDALGQDADIIWLLHRQEEEQEDPTVSSVHVEIIQDKGRGCGTGSIHTAFYGQTQTFQEIKNPNYSKA